MHHDTKIILNKIHTMRDREREISQTENKSLRPALMLPVENHGLSTQNLKEMGDLAHHITDVRFNTLTPPPHAQAWAAWPSDAWSFFFVGLHPRVVMVLLEVVTGQPSFILKPWQLAIVEVRVKSFTVDVEVPNAPLISRRCYSSLLVSESTATVIASVAKTNQNNNFSNIGPLFKPKTNQDLSVLIADYQMVQDTLMELQTNYISDVEFVETRTSQSIDTEFRTSSLEIQFNNVRSFPQGKQNRYHVQPPQGKGSKHLIRTCFMYGNYDGQHKTHEFDLYLGVNLWDSVILDNETTILTKEIIHTLGSDHVQVCLVDKGRGTPFMSVLELRLLKNDIYETPHDKLMLNARRDVGSIRNISVRYKDDAYDRLWTPRQFGNFTTLNTSLAIDQASNNSLQPPLIVMRTANAPREAIQYINMLLEPKDPEGKFYIYMHFAEIVKLQRNETREFTILVNGDPMEPTVFSPRFLFTDTISNKNPVNGSRIEISIRPTNRSTLEPIINAIEVYQVNESLQPPTHQLDVDAIMKIRAMYRVKKDWNLSSSGLSCLIDPAFCNLTSIQKLDLSNNSLKGNVLDCFAYLPSLTELCIQQVILIWLLYVFLQKLGKKPINGLASTETTGEVKHRITEAKKRLIICMVFLLDLAFTVVLASVSGNPGLFLSSSCQETKKNEGYNVLLVASLIGVLFL
ncbi:hypothetical protein Bca52824_016712 [Brassica carinata]|uniref:Malectin-like domain-containing protein n=1 Tax=Brassica carinata TaxID=52824 RepID=A0A8X8B4B8_BRACI|nr:hypothetical protein Bca52824_016712 [Brassica carinata]